MMTWMLMYLLQALAGAGETLAGVLRSGTGLWMELELLLSPMT